MKPKKKTPPVPAEAMARVREALEVKFIAIKNRRRRRTDVVAFAKVDGIEYILFKNGRWGCGANADHYRLDEPESQRTRYSGPGRRHRGNARYATDGLVVLGLITAADRDALETYFREKDRARTYAADVRELEWRAKDLGVELVFPEEGGK